MKNVVVVAPYFGANMLHAMRCFAALEDTRLGVVSNESPERLPADLKARFEGHYQVKDAMSAAQLVEAGRAYQKEWGRVDRLEGYLEQLQVPLGEARDALGVDGMGGEAAANFRDKNRMKRVLSAAGLPVARQALISSLADARRFVEAVGYPIVLKPVDGAGAKNTMRASDDDELFMALNALLPSESSPVQGEEFIQGEEHTFETVTLGGAPVWSSSTFYLPGPMAVLENPWMQYCLLMPREETMPHIAAFKGTNAAALSALGMVNGLSHMEWFLRGNGRVYIGEVGARPPGANILLVNGAAYEVDLWAKWARLMVHRTWEMPARRYAAGCAFIRGQGRGNTVRALHGVDAVNEKIGALVVQSRLPRVGQPHSTHYEGDGWVIVRHPQTEGVMAALQVVYDTLRVR